MTEETLEVEPVMEPVNGELALLKERADIMGIKYHPSIGMDKLKEKIKEKTAPPVEAASPEEYDSMANGINVSKASKGAPVIESEGQKRVRLRKNATKLVRIRLTCMNPSKNSLPGEIFSAGNAAIGMVKKFVPFNAEAGWHVPQIIYTQIKDRKYVAHYEVKIGNKKIKKHKLLPEFAIELLPPLTDIEIKELSQRQLLNN